MNTFASVMLTLIEKHIQISNGDRYLGHYGLAAAPSHSVVSAAAEGSYPRPLNIAYNHT
jgi:hypothetical protein